jgi:hypothetical protein
MLIDRVRTRSSMTWAEAQAHSLSDLKVRSISGTESIKWKGRDSQYNYQLRLLLSNKIGQRHANTTKEWFDKQIYIYIYIYIYLGPYYSVLSIRDWDLDERKGRLKSFTNSDA